MYHKILVPLDGSQVAEGVLPHARDLAESQGAELVLLTVATNPVMDFAFSDPALALRAEQEQQEQSRAYMAQVQDQLKTAGFRVSTLIRNGAVADVILQVAEETKADLIAMSTHGRTGPARWLLAAWPNALCANRPCRSCSFRAKG